MASYAFKGGLLIDGTGKAAVENSLVLTKEKKIVYAGAEKDIPREYHIIDISGKKVWVGGQGTEDGEVDLAVYVQNGSELTKLEDQPRIWWKALMM